MKVSYQSASINLNNAHLTIPGRIKNGIHRLEEPFIKTEIIYGPKEVGQYIKV
jgi:hypothetical protein